MEFLLTMGGVLTCSFGTAPSSMIVLPMNGFLPGGSMPAANIMDNKPLVNILPFAMCSCPANPMVAAATAAAMGVLTPMPCLPVTAAPWIPGSPMVLIGNQPAVSASCTLMCAYGGIISINTPGQFEMMC